MKDKTNIFSTTSKEKASALYYAFSDYLRGDSFNMEGDS